ncbi:MAG: GNAT family N-acetyltransferase [Oscillospiraceae bacterium]|nr:GNAT family N-acetyltransferase [Oscillospiraceae bacterium]
MNMLIRPMVQKDKKEVLKMMRVFYDSPAVQYTAPDEILEKDIDDCLNDMPYLDGFVIEKSEKIIGYAMTAKSYTTEYGGICVWLEDLYLKPEYRHLGIAKELFLFIENYYPEAVRFKLEVEPENEFAVKCYQKYGYQNSPYFEMTKEIK